MANSGFKLTGQSKVIGNLRRIRDDVPQRASQALRVEAEGVATLAKQQYVPIDLSALKNSLRAHDVKRIRDILTVIISAGDTAAPYAAAVHEHPSQSSPWTWQGQVTFHPAGHGPKFLRRAMDDRLSGMANRIADRVRPR